MTRPMRNGFHDTTAVSDWHPETAAKLREAGVITRQEESQMNAATRVRLSLPPFPVIEAPIPPARMSASDRMELKALAERVGPTYGSFAITSRALEDLVAWVEGYAKRGAE